MFVIVCAMSLATRAVADTASSTATKLPPAGFQTVPAADAEIVLGFRKVIVLMEQEPTGTDGGTEHAAMVGRLIFHQNRTRVTALSDRLLASLDASRSSSEVTLFLDDLERNPNYRDADKLALRDVLADLAAGIRERPQKVAQQAALLARMEEDLHALSEIQALYEKELGRIADRLGARGMPVRREAWGAYLAYLRKTLSRDEILREYADLPLNVPHLRGKAPSPAGELNGSTMPPNTLLLTFDDGPHARYTERVLKILKEQGVGAVFFQVGANIGKVDDKAKVTLGKAAAASRAILAAGMPLANHSFSHPVLPSLSLADLDKEIDNTTRLIHEVSQHDPVMFRAPYGARNESILSAVLARNLTSIMWNIDSRDWADPIPASIAARVLETVEKERRGIILFHDIHERTVEALPSIIEALRGAGYQFASWDGQKFVVAAASEVVAPKPASTTTGPYRESWAVVIGIDNYSVWPRLRYAVNDARAVQELLVRKYRFKPGNVFTLFDQDATRQNILSLLGDKLANPEMVKRDDRVFVFFAGHGATRKLPSGRELGYIIPVDADMANYQGQAVSMSNFQDISEGIPAKHVLFVMDSCYSGLALTRGGRPATGQNFMQEVARRSARQMLTAGGADQQVADNGPNGHSVFTWTLMQALEGSGDLNGDGYITAGELAAHIGPIVSSLSRQTPAFGSLPGSEGGEFVFELAHENEFLSQLSGQLDQEAIQLNDEIARLRADITAKSQRNEKLKQELVALKQSDPALVAKRDTAQIRNDRGMSLFRERKYKEAAEEFLAASRLDPRSALITNNLGFAYYRLDNLPDAVQWFEKSIELDPNRAIAYLNLGDAYVKLNRVPDARKAFVRYLELQPAGKLAAYAQDQIKVLSVR
jgi:peptidoglycan/xylan/chitin deacetylase (PgdA/CDA1 family)/uncharacterized caspase-like protein